MQKIIKNNLRASVVWVLFFSLTLSLTPLPERKANAWMETFITNPALGGMQEVLKQLNIVVTGAAKQAAIKAINKAFSQIVGGSNGSGPKFVTDWTAALIDDSEETAALFIDSLAASTTGNSGTSGFSSEGVGGSSNYFLQLKQNAMNIPTQYTSSSRCKITYTSNPEEMLTDQENFSNLGKFMAGPNSSLAYGLCMKEEYQKKLEDLKRIAEVKLIANKGFLGTETNGQTIYPGVLIADQMANINDMGNKAITSASGIAEVVISSVTGLVFQQIDQGIGDVQNQIQKKISNQ